MKMQPAIACAILLLTGCADLTWQKAGADPAVAATDMQQCKLNALMTARRLSPVSVQSPMGAGSPSGPAAIAPALNQQPDIFTEQTLVSECMRGRGYRLEKAN